MQNSSFYDQHVTLISKILFTLVMLIICRVGVYIPIAGIDSNNLKELLPQNQVGILGMFNMLSGGAFVNMSIFALAIMPYITASIIIQLLSMAYPALENLKKDGERGRQQIIQLTRYCTIALASFQAFGIAIWLENFVTESGAVVIMPGVFFRLTTVITLVVGTMFLMWIGEQISSHGIGNGSSLIIFIGIISSIPKSIIATFELARKGEDSPFLAIAIIAVMIILIGFIVFFEKAQRRILVHYPRRQLGNKVYGGDTTHIPLKLNTAGVIPPIFASSLLLFPLTVLNLSQNNKDSEILQSIVSYFSPGKIFFILCYGLLIIFFSIFYTAIVFNSDETAEI
ncbi:preprotein translocase, SecY subunit [Orientia chuto str. Dubai]|uniref:Protein translocase subunit SecY n=1 Tax=Orientia chuto str. Dubai TaxID=1359168 RepID=A0A0F3ML13_9RICK|nr:preprotein translocase, SecY subunit [Orientia chuto str. Dubai]